MDASYVDTRNPAGLFLYSCYDRSCLWNVVGSPHLEIWEERKWYIGQTREMVGRRKRRKEKKGNV